MKKTAGLFFLSVGCLLLLTALSKFISRFGTARILQASDPIFGFQYEYLFEIAGVFELGVAAICILSKDVVLRGALVLWLSTLFLVYRLGLSVRGIQHCPCLGNLTEKLHLSLNTADTIMKCILGYMLVGSAIILITSKKKWSRRHSLCSAVK